MGAEDFQGDYLHFGADDLEPHAGWWQPLVEACDAGMCPCPVVLEPDGRVQSMGGTWGWELRAEGEDWEPVDWTTVPFMSREQWEVVSPMPAELHYCTDAWVSARLAVTGTLTVLRREARFTHHNALAGRGAGMDVHVRNRHDRARFAQLLAEVT